jgi:hypothetical protein
MGGDEALRQLRELADHFPAPTYGRYVKQPPMVNEYGVALLPPPVPDRVKRLAIGAIAAGTLAAVAMSLVRRRDGRSSGESDWQSGRWSDWKSSQPDWRAALDRDDETESAAETTSQAASNRWDWRKPA